MGFLAFGLFLTLIGLVLTVLPAGDLSTTLVWAGGIAIALGITLVIVHVAVGPPLTRRGRRA